MTTTPPRTRAGCGWRSTTRFHDVHSRTPSVRFGALHAFDNLYEGGGGSAVNLRIRARALVENDQVTRTGDQCQAVSSFPMEQKAKQV
ncbi:hypothetical protein [Streptomyces acidiscabies]|uniref:pectate lyase family protein n=1 Tax=Streptomyces acidiscabies TaxID=42234 RepID=UPI0038F7CBE2